MKDTHCHSIWYHEPNFWLEIKFKFLPSYMIFLGEKAQTFLLAPTDF